MKALVIAARSLTARRELGDVVGLFPDAWIPSDLERELFAVAQVDTAQASAVMIEGWAPGPGDEFALRVVDGRVEKKSRAVSWSEDVGGR